jgi:hypothetical protein
MKMKYLMIAAAFFGATVTVSAFAQSNPSNSQSASAATEVASNTTDQWVPPYGQPVAGKTRAQIYEELVQAEQDGQLAYLDSTLYAHS